jgi:hypothetical protein
MVLCGTAEADAECAKNSFIKAAAGGQVPDHKVDVVDQPATMKLLNFHTDSPFSNRSNVPPAGLFQIRSQSRPVHAADVCEQFALPVAL